MFFALKYLRLVNISNVALDPVKKIAEVFITHYFYKNGPIAIHNLVKTGGIPMLDKIITTLSSAEIQV